jgi:hypothetical protein
MCDNSSVVDIGITQVDVRLGRVTLDERLFRSHAAEGARCP